MKPRHALSPVDWLALLLGGVLSAYALLGVAIVPFHPDESTQLFMSADFETWLTEPLTLAWTPQTNGDLRTHYRLVDVPLTRYLLGAVRVIAGLPPLPADWNWSQTWAENAAAGALPEGPELKTGRLFLTLLIPLDLLLLYKLGKRLQGGATGLIALGLFGLNALVLLHNRRAMAEAGLTFGVLLTLWAVLDQRHRPWLAGLALALAVNAKQTGAVLLPLGLLALAIPASPEGYASNHQPLRRYVMRWGIYLLVFGLVTLALNPFLWRYPIQGARAAWEARQELMGRQLTDISRLYPERAPESTSMRLVALIANLYLTPPAFAETANYQAQTASVEAAYLAQPGHNLLRGLAFGGLMLVLCLSGMLLAGLDLRRAHRDQRRAICILLLATLLLAAGIFLLIPIPWQRYVMPLVPLTCLWAAYLPGRVIEQIRTRNK